MILILTNKNNVVEWVPLPDARSVVQRHGPLHLAQGTPHPRPPCGLQQRDQPQPPGPIRFFNVSPAK